MIRDATAWVLSLFWLVPSLSLMAADTGVYRGPDNNGVYPEKGLLKEWPPEGPKLLWKQPLNQGYAGVAVVSGLVYVAHGAGVNFVDVFTLDGERLHHIPTGSSAWKRFSGTRSTPIVEGDVVVTTTPDAHVYGVDLRTGNVRWKLNAWTNFGSGASAMGWGLPESPMYHDGTAIFDTCSRLDQTPPLVAVDVQSGRVVWGADAGRTNKKYSAGDVSGACFNHNGRALIAYPTWRYLLCVDANTGRRLWEIADTSEKTLTPCYSEGRLLWGPSGRTQMLKLSADGSNYEVLWTRHGGVPGFSHAVVLDGRVYMFGNPYMKARTPAEQTDSLVEEGIGYVFETPDVDRAPESVRTNGPRAVAEWQRQAQRATHLLCLDADTGRLLQSRPAADPGHIVAADGMVYVLELVDRDRDKTIVPRVSLIRPTQDGFETTGTLVPPFAADELCWDSQRTARGEQQRQWAREDFLFQRNVNPAIAEGRLFLRYGPLQVYDLREKDWAPQPTTPVSAVRHPDATSSNVASIAESAPDGAREAVERFASRYLDERVSAVQELAALSGEKQKQLLPVLVKLLDVEGARAWLVQQCATAVLQTHGAAASQVAQSLRERALIALDKGSGHFAEHLLMTLQAVCPAVMTQAVTSAGCRLHSEDAIVRRQTMAALKVVGSTAAAVAEPLAQCLSSADRRMVNESAALLKSLKEEARAAVPTLQAGLTNAVARRDPARVELIASVLQGIDSNGVTACVGKLAGFIGNPDPCVVGLALRTLNRAGAVSVDAVPHLVAGMKSDDRLVAEESVVMLDRLGPRARTAVGTLVQYVTGETGALRVASAELLGKIGPDAGTAVALLSAGVRGSDLPFARASARALGRIGADAAPAIANLVAAMGGRDTELARVSVSALGAIGKAVSDTVEPSLLNALRHRDEPVRTNAVAALRSMGRDPVPSLLAIARGGDRRLAAWAAVTVGRIGPEAKGAVPDLVSFLSDKDGSFVMASVEALGGIGRDAVVALPELMVLARRADRRSGDAIQRTLDRIKTGNLPPTATDVKAVCEEGKTVVLRMPVDDPDDAPGTLVAEIAQGPAHGTLTRASNTEFVYRAAYGTAVDDAFIWKATDRVLSSGAATAAIDLTPDLTPPAVTRTVVWTNEPSVRIEFDEPLSIHAAMDPLNYGVEPEVGVKRVEVNTNGMVVSLYTDPLVEGNAYTLVLRGLLDRSTAANALAARRPVKCLSQGLACDYHEALDGVFDRDLFDLIRPTATGVAPGFDLSLRERDQRFHMRFQGILKAPASGEYTFWVNADDRARFYVGTNLVVESADGRERSGRIRMDPGANPVCLIYVQNGGTNILSTAWSGPGFGRQAIPEGVLYHTPGLAR